MAKPVIMVTGASSGIGRAAVVRLRAADALVVATARQESELRHLLVPGEVESLRLDVADDASRAAAVGKVLARHGRIDAIVNNAGFGANLTVEDTPAEKLRAMMEVNLVGAHDLARRVLPTMRAQGRGRIVNVGSMAGHVAVPMMGAYCATKFALRALTEAMDNEVRPFGVRALLIEPTWIATGFGSRTIREGMPEPLQAASPYANMYRKWHERRAKPHGPGPDVVARRIARACLAAAPPFHSYVPTFAKVANVAKRLLPDAAIDWGMRQYFR